MPNLVTDDEMYAYLGITDPDTVDPDGVILALRNSAEEMLSASTNRVYGPGEVIVREFVDGPGGYRIYVRRPIASLQTIEFRYLPETVQESYFTLDITQYITFTVGKRRIQSHVYEFPCGTDNVLISYTSSDDMPAMAKAAVMDVVSSMQNRKGSEGYRGERKGSYEYTLARSIDESSIWAKAVELLNIPAIG